MESIKVAGEKIQSLTTPECRVISVLQGGSISPVNVELPTTKSAEMRGNKQPALGFGLFPTDKSSLSIKLSN